MFARSAVPLAMLTAAMTALAVAAQDPHSGSGPPPRVSSPNPGSAPVFVGAPMTRAPGEPASWIQVQCERVGSSLERMTCTVESTRVAPPESRYATELRAIANRANRSVVEERRDLCENTRDTWRGPLSVTDYCACFGPRGDAGVSAIAEPTRSERACVRRVMLAAAARAEETCSLMRARRAEIVERSGPLTWTTRASTSAMPGAATTTIRLESRDDTWSVWTIRVETCANGTCRSLPGFAASQYESRASAPFDLPPGARACRGFFVDFDRVR